MLRAAAAGALPALLDLQGSPGRQVRRHRERSFALPSAGRKDECLYPPFQADRLANGLIVVYFPGSPDAWNGSLALVGPDRMQAMDVPFAALIDIYERLGRDSSSQLNTAVGRIETRNIQPGTA